MKDTVIKLKEEDVEVISSDDLIHKRSTKFTENAFEDPKAMVYEKSNAFALSYYGISKSEQSLLLAGLVAAYNVNKAAPYTEAEKEAGIQCYVPIKHVAKMMGYDITDKNKKSFYMTIKSAATKLTKAKGNLIEKEDHNGFSVFVVISQIDYNKFNDGQIAFKFSPGASDLFLNNEKDFTLYSLILANKMRAIGRSYAVSLHEVLRTSFYKAKRSERGFVEVYYDFIDFKCKLFLINTNNAIVQNILNDPRYQTNFLLNNDKLAYERALQIEALDVPIKEKIKQLKGSKEYKRIQEYKKSTEYKEAVKHLKNLAIGSEEYENLYATKIKEVADMDQQLMMLQNAIICQYSEWKDFSKRILIPSQKAFLEAIRDTDLMDMMFEYKPYCYKRKAIGICFTIYTVDAYKKKELEQGVQMSLFDYLKEKEGEESMTPPREIYEDVGGARKHAPVPKRIRLSSKRESVYETLSKIEPYIKSNTVSGMENLTAAEMLSLANLCDFEYFKEKYDMMKEKQGIKSPMAWLTSAIKENYQPGPNESREAGNAGQFNQFLKRDYDFEQLEKELIDN